ncbi:MAG: DUF1800 domain-containing protein [Cypionkella sp.]|uniref:DUF1800 domain-containing protein n=1 Tax=Cypionkella sp. TaxID=2811411 RepID=UPI002ABA8940|nr:DUF1800 domain-containing protein [Cypionkella sp.]MDZ4311175.1 DUF1800 domain-containing protein [Cypionkella sp.]MDZ4395973.1 DUF1800 domain-containing protein [Cypionkella sp.]
MSKLTTLAAIRFGYGLPQAKGAPDTPDAILAMLAGPDRAMQSLPIRASADLIPNIQELRQIQKAGKKATAKNPKRDALLQDFTVAAQQATVVTFARALDSADGFRERLTTFWADHFSVIAKRQLEALFPYALVDDAIRPHLTGNFADMLTAATLHPAMLSYLDQSSSVGPNSHFGKNQRKGLNENLAREVIELHSMGVGAKYSQTDVTEMAKILAGLTMNADLLMEFQPRRAEPGPRELLGKTYDAVGLDNIHAALRDLALQPATGQHLARKLAVHFVSDSPDASLVKAIATAYNGSGGDLMATYTAMLNHPAAWAEVTEKARQPFDFMVASLRALGINGQQLQKMPYKQFRGQVLAPMVGMGQPFKRPGGPNGFDEAAEEWITPQGLARRITWAMRVPPRLVEPLPDPVTLAQTCLADRASEALLWGAARAEDITQGVGLVLASAEFNRR